MKSHTGSGFIRIIGGEFKGRRLKVLSQPGLRPTSDRVRETIFNWLQGYVSGARVLDLFAGTGALGLEALSRGAQQVVFVEFNSKVIPNIKTAISTLECHHRAYVMRADSVKWLNESHAEEPFDIIFIDPPFGLSLWLPCLERLIVHRYVKPSTLVYLETPKSWNCPQNDFPWRVKKHQTAGEVSYYLLEPILPLTEKS